MPSITVSPSDNLDAALTYAPAGCEVILSDGEYKTRGAWAFPQSNHRSTKRFVRLISKNGATKTRLKLGDDAERFTGGKLRPDRDLTVLWTDYGTSVSGITIDGNQAKFADADPTKTWLVSNGLRSQGLAFYEDVVVESVRGTHKTVMSLSPSVEGFGIAAEGPLEPVEGFTTGSVIRRCVVQNCPDRAYVSAIGIGHYGAYTPRSTIEDCVVNTGTGNWYGYAAYQNVQIARCKVLGGCNTAVYNDTYSTTDLHVSDCDFAGVERLASFISPTGVYAKTNIVLENIRCVLNSGDKNILELWDMSVGTTQPALTGPVLLRKLNVSQPGGGRPLLTAAGRMIMPVVIMDSVLPDVVYSTMGSQLALFNCVGQSGKPVVVKKL